MMVTGSARAADSETRPSSVPKVSGASRNSSPPPLAAQPFDLKEVRLLDGPFREAMLRDKAYLLSLDPERLLVAFHINYGMATNARPYGGWEEPKSEVRGHCLGHYLSACSLMYASTGDAEPCAQRNA